MPPSPSLYGISNSNRSAEKHWTKNCFNSSFPTSLACWMRDNNIPATYVCLNEHAEIVNSPISISDVFGSELPNSQLHFAFESTFAPYAQFAYDDISGIDLVIHDSNGTPIRPLEIKLTVVPDTTTSGDAEEHWSSEIVIRPATTKFCALGMAYGSRDNLAEVLRHFDDVCNSIEGWGNRIEILQRFDEIVGCLNSYQRAFAGSQRPFLLQPIWKTKGTTAALADPAFDLIVWSDHALCKAFIENGTASRKPAGVTRQMRAIVRLARVLWEISRGQKTRLSDIYTSMAFGHQTDKEFSFNGKITRKFITSRERAYPRIRQGKLREIILHGGEKLLSPERRFDASIFFSVAQLFEQENATTKNSGATN